MHDGLPPLGWLRTFEAAARRRGFAEAARELAMTPTAVSQQMRALEQRLGARLFVRLARGVALTDVGAAYLPAVRDALDGLASATAGLFEPAARSGVALRCTASFALIVVAPTLPAFRAAHPRIDLSLHTAIWSDAVMDERIDLEVRHGAGPWEGFESEPLAPGLSAPICPPDLDLAGPPDAALARAMGRGLIHIAGCENLWADAARRFGLPAPDLARGWRADTSAVALEMAAAGAGCALVSVDLAASALRTGRVVSSDAIRVPHPQRHHLLTRRRARALGPAALIVRDWLREAARAEANERAAE
jgi:LysR family glycine cleavage system transcriptional activator